MSGLDDYIKATKVKSLAITKQVGDAHKLTKGEAKKHFEINRDIDDMIEWAKPARRQGKDAIQGYQAIANLTKQGRSNIFPPTIHAVVYSRMAMEAANLPRVEYKHRLGASQPKMKWINAARKQAEAGDNNMRPAAIHLWMNQNFDKILFGVGFRYLSYLLQTRVIKITDSNGKVKEKKVTVYDDIWDENLDFFHTGVSRDMLPGMFQGRACYFDKFFQRDVFLEKFDNENYMNIGTVKNSDWFKANDFIRVRYYYDLYQDLFYVQACQKDPFDGGDENAEYSYPIRDDFIQDYGPEERPEKFLPITTLHNTINFDMKQESEFNILQAGRQFADVANPSNNKTFYSKSDPNLIRALVAAKNVLWRANIDLTKASTVNFLLTQSTGIFDQVKTADLYGVVPIRNADEKSFDVKSMLANSDFLSKWEGADSMLDNAMTYSLGNDWKRIATDLTNEKATIAAIKNNVQQIGMKYNMKFNESGPIPRHYRVLLNLIQQYYPEEQTIEMADGDELPDGVTEEKSIIRDLDGKPIGYKKPKMIPIDEEIIELQIKTKDGTKYRPMSADHPDAPKDQLGSTLLPARAEYLVTEEIPEIYIEPGSTFEELKALEKSLEMEKISAYTPFLGLSYPDADAQNQPGQPPAMKPLIGKDGAEYLIKSMAEVFGDDPEKLFPPTGAASATPQKKEAPFSFLKGMPPPQAATPGMPAQVLPQGGAPSPAQAPNSSPLAQAASLRQGLTP